MSWPQMLAPLVRLEHPRALAFHMMNVVGDQVEHSRMHGVSKRRQSKEFIDVWRWLLKVHATFIRCALMWRMNDERETRLF